MPKSQTNSWHQEEPIFKTDFHRFEQVQRVFGKPVITKRQEHEPRQTGKDTKARAQFC